MAPSGIASAPRAMAVLMAPAGWRAASHSMKNNCFPVLKATKLSPRVGVSGQCFSARPSPVALSGWLHVGRLKLHAPRAAARQPATPERGGSSKKRSRDTDFVTLFVQTLSNTGFFPASTPFPKAIQVATAVMFGGACFLIAEISNEVLQAVERIPFLGQVEMVVGFVVLVQFAMRFLTADSGRARLESMVDNVLDKVAGKDLTEDGDDSGPRMLEVQLRSVVDEHIPIEPTEGAPESLPRQTVFVMKQSLATALMSFILARESKSQRMSKVLRQDLEAERGQVKKLKAKLVDKAEVERVLQADVTVLQAAGLRFQEERDAALEQVAALTARVDAVTAELERVTVAQGEVTGLNEELKARVAAVMAENLLLQSKAEDLEASDRARAAAVSALEAALSESEAEVGQWQQQQEETQRAAERLEALLESAAQELSLERAEVARLQDGQATLSGDLAQARAMLADQAELARELANLRLRLVAAEGTAEELVQVRGLLEEKEGRLREAEEELERQRERAVRELEEMGARMEAALHAAQADKAEATALAAELEWRLAELQEQQSRQRGQEAAMSAAMQQAGEEAARRENTVRSLQLELQQAQDSIEKLAQQAVDAHASAADQETLLKAQVAERERSVASLKSELLLAQKKHSEQATAAKEQLERALEDLESTRSSAETMAEEAAAKARAVLKDQLAKAEGGREEQRRAVERLESELKARREEGEKRAQAVAFLKAQLQEEQKQRSAEAAAAKLEISSLTSRLNASVQRAELDVAQAQQLVTALKAQVAEQDGGRMAAADRVRQLEAALGAAEKASQEAVAAVDALKQTAKADSDGAVKRVAELEKELHQLTSKWEEAQAQANSAEQRLRATASGAEAIMAKAPDAAPGRARSFARTASPGQQRNRGPRVVKGGGVVTGGGVVGTVVEKSGASGAGDVGSNSGVKKEGKEAVMAEAVVGIREQVAVSGKEVTVMSPEKQEELRLYTRSIRGQYLDLTKPAGEQREAVDGLVKHLVSRGAVEKWAWEYVTRSLAYEVNKLKKKK